MEQTAILKVSIDPHGVITGASIVSQKFNEMKRSGKEVKAEVDKSSAAVTNFGKSAESISSPFKRFQNSLRTTFTPLKELEASLHSVQAILYGAAAYTVYSALNKVIDAASESERVIARLDQTLKASHQAAGLSSKELQNMATSLQRMTGVSDETIISAQTLLLSFQEIGKETFPQALRVAMDLSEVMGSDLQSAIRQVGIALADPTEGITQLRRSGVIFSNTQELIIKNLVEEGKLFEAQALILDTLEGKYGGVAEAAGKTFSGERNKVAQEFGDILEKLGGTLTAKEGPLMDGLTSLNALLMAINDNWGTVYAAYSFFKSGVNPLGRVYEAGSKIGKAGYDKLFESEENIGTAIDDYAARVKTAQETTKPFMIKVQQKPETALSGTSPDDLQMIEELKALDEIAQEEKKLNDQRLKEQVEYNQELARLIYEGREMALADITKSAEDKTRAITEYNETVASGIERAMEEGRTHTSQYMEDLGKSMETWAKRNDTLITSWEDKFTDAVMNVHDRGIEAFGDFFDYVGNSLKRIMIDEWITKPVSSGLQGLFGRASGGPVSAGTPYIVGENRRPELFVPSQNGTVVPMDKIGGQTVVQIIDQRSSSNSAPVSVSRQKSNGGELIRVVIEEVKGAMGAGQFDTTLANNFGLLRTGRG
jgi:hypothetical protein